MKIIITGSEGLIGKATSTYLSNEGHEIVRVDQVLGHDLSNEGFVRSWFKENPADALVNLFALNDHVDSSARNETFLDLSLDSFSLYLEINVTSLFSVCREFIRSNDAGAIVNASSIYGVQSPRPVLYGGGEKHLGYGVSKAAVLALSRHLAVHAAPKFRVNSVVFGGIENNQPSDFIERYGANVPLGRMGDKDEVAPVIEFLVTSQSKYMTGSSVTFDGGWTA